MESGADLEPKQLRNCKPHVVELTSIQTTYVLCMSKSPPMTSVCGKRPPPAKSLEGRGNSNSSLCSIGLKFGFGLVACWERKSHTYPCPRPEYVSRTCETPIRARRRCQPNGGLPYLRCNTVVRASEIFSEIFLWHLNKISNFRERRSLGHKLVPSAVIERT